MFSSSAIQRRSLMPVRWVIHSSLESMWCSRYSLSITRDGVADPTDRMRANFGPVLALIWVMCSCSQSWAG